MADRPRINKNHGFLTFINKNQLNRRDYNDWYEDRKKQLRTRLDEQVEKKGITHAELILAEPNLNLRRFDKHHVSVDEICTLMKNYKMEPKTEAPNKALFKLILSWPDGTEKTRIILVSDLPARVAKELTMEYGFDDSQCRNLRLFLEDQIKKRLMM